MKKKITLKDDEMCDGKQLFYPVGMQNIPDGQDQKHSFYCCYCKVPDSDPGRRSLGNASHNDVLFAWHEHVIIRVIQFIE